MNSNYPFKFTPLLKVFFKSDRQNHFLVDVNEQYQMKMVVIIHSKYEDKLNILGPFNLKIGTFNSTILFSIENMSELSFPITKTVTEISLSSCALFSSK